MARTICWSAISFGATSSKSGSSQNTRSTCRWCGRCDMVEYHFHWITRSGESASSTVVTVSEQSDRHGAALALRIFRERGCDISAALGHLDLTDDRGFHRVLLVDEVVEWLKQPGQAAFVEREGLNDIAAPMASS